MLDLFGPGTTLGYCTNVHPESSRDRDGSAGRTRIDDVQGSLLKHACAVKDRVCPNSPLPLGLWLSAKAATQLIGDTARFESFRDFLGTHGLAPFTFNAFPRGDFHGPVVKHRVYRPDWSEYERLEYTVAIAAIAADLCPAGAEVSISTLPVCWGKSRAGTDGDPCDLAAAATSLRSLARHLARVEQDTGRLIHVDLEPEPGCYLDTAPDVVRFFESHLLRRGQEDMIRRHIRICHDVCHSAVMQEDQAFALQSYATAGLLVGKVQISAAIGMDLADLPTDRRAEALRQLSQFAEDRYLHQTTIGGSGGGGGSARCTRFFEDLPDALAAAADLPELRAGSWRTHFHVPIFLEAFGELRSTASQIAPAIAAARHLHDTRHFEVETYAWGVLPPELRDQPLAEGIARELTHARSLAPQDRRA
jgi:hypothetical protein